MNDRKTSTAQPTAMTIEARQRGLETQIHLEPSVHSFFLFILTLPTFSNDSRYGYYQRMMNLDDDEQMAANTSTTPCHNHHPRPSSTCRSPLPLPAHQYINTCLPPSLNTTTLTWGLTELDLSHMYDFILLFYIY